MTAPTATQRETLRKLLDKALVEATLALPFQSASSLPAAAKDELEFIVRELCLAKDLQRLAALWEPRRKLDAVLKDTLRQDLIDLLRGRRRPYEGLVVVPLSVAHGDLAGYRILIEQSIPTTDAKKLLKAWDKNLRPMPTARDDIVGHLLRLLTAKQAA